MLYYPPPQLQDSLGTLPASLGPGFHPLPIDYQSLPGRDWVGSVTKTTRFIQRSGRVFKTYFMVLKKNLSNLSALYT